LWQHATIEITHRDHSSRTLIPVVFTFNRSPLTFPEITGHDHSVLFFAPFLLVASCTLKATPVEGLQQWHTSLLPVERLSAGVSAQISELLLGEFDCSTRA